MIRYNLIIKEEARTEISDAYFWYEEKQNKLGERFLNKLDDCLINMGLLIDVCLRFLPQMISNH